jgi:hypothetical protein
MVIQQSKKYECFENIIGNRVLSVSKIDKICSDVSNGFNMLPYCPIVVSESEQGFFHIIDGQHRFEVSKKTNNPVYYVVCNTLSLKQIAQLNSRGDKWKANDFLNCYINLGIEDYKALKSFMKAHDTNIKLSTDLLMYNKHTEKSTDDFQSGDFRVKFFDEATFLVELTESIFKRYAFSRDRYLIGAVQAIAKKGKCDFEKLKQKIGSAPNIMDKQGDVKNYIYNIERVYNHKNSIREVIY